MCFTCNTHHPFEQLVLPAEQLERRRRTRLAGQLHNVSDDRDDGVRTARHDFRLVKQCLVEGRGDGDVGARLPVREQFTFWIGDQFDDVRAARNHDIATLRRELAYAVEHRRDHLKRLSLGHPRHLPRIAGPVSQLVLRIIGERPHDRDPARHLGIGDGKRQHTVVA